MRDNESNPYKPPSETPGRETPSQPKRRPDAFPWRAWWTGFAVNLMLTLAALQETSGGMWAVIGIGWAILLAAMIIRFVTTADPRGHR